MKYIKFFLISIGLLIVVFLLIGVIKPDVTYEREVIVDKPVAESWAVMQDEEKMPEWLTGFQRIEHISGTPGTVGAVSDVYFDNNGEVMAIRETITDVVPQKSISMTFQSDFMDMDYTLVMAPLDDQTKISTSTTAEGNSMISKSIMALVSGSIKGQEETNLSKLKETIESNTKNYFPTEEDVSENNED